MGVLWRGRVPKICIAGTIASGLPLNHGLGMNLIARHMKKKRRRQLADKWTPSQTADRAQHQLVDASFELTEAARDLNQTAGIRGSSPATAAVLGSTTHALHSQANAMNRIRSLIRHELAPSAPKDSPEADVDELHELLGEIEESLRDSAADVDRARQLTAGILDGLPAAFLESL